MLARTLEDVQMPGEAKANEITPAFLDAFADAWNRHDVDAIMSAMTDDCVFEASAGVGVKERRCDLVGLGFARHLQSSNVRASIVQAVGSRKQAIPQQHPNARQISYNGG